MILDLMLERDQALTKASRLEQRLGSLFGADALADPPKTAAGSGNRGQDTGAAEK